MIPSEQTIPAAAGYYSLSFLDGTQGYARFPIVAWHYDHVSTFPIIAGEPVEGIKFILCPDGTVNDLDDGATWQSVKNWHDEQIGKMHHSGDK